MESGRDAYMLHYWKLHPQNYFIWSTTNIDNERDFYCAGDPAYYVSLDEFSTKNSEAPNPAYSSHVFGDNKLFFLSLSLSLLLFSQHANSVGSHSQAERGERAQSWWILRCAKKFVLTSYDEELRVHYQLLKSSFASS